MLPPEEKHSSLVLAKGQEEILPRHSSVSAGICLHLVLEKSIRKPNRSEKTLVLSKSVPDPPALKKYGFRVAYRSVACV